MTPTPDSPTPCSDDANPSGPSQSSQPDRADDRALPSLKDIDASNRRAPVDLIYDDLVIVWSQETRCAGSG